MKRITLTPKQAALILWACKAGLEQHEKFLRHDDWDWGYSEREKYKSKWADRKFQRAINLMNRKINP